MANWTDIPDSVLEPAKPIRSIDGLALRDNPVAIVEGAPGAPRIQNPAYGETSISFDKLFTGAATRFGSDAFNLTYGESSGTSFSAVSIDVPGTYMAVVMGQWSGVGIAGRWVRLYHGSNVLIEGDQVADRQLWTLAPVSAGNNDFRIEFERPSGGVITMPGSFIVFAPIR